MSNGVTRATIVWIVAAAVVGGAAGVAWVLRSELGGAHTGTPLVVASIVLTLLAAALLYHAIMVAAGEQDRRADLVEQRRPTVAPSTGPATADDEPITFRRGQRL